MPRASESRLIPIDALATAGPVPLRHWQPDIQRAACNPGSRRRRSSSPNMLRYTGCSCDAEPVPCLDIDVCAATLGEPADRGRLAIVTVHDLQIPFEKGDDRGFRRYLRPAHFLFYEQESLQKIKERH